MSVSIKPLEDRIVIKQVDAETTTASGLVIPDTAKEKPQEGDVVAVGPGRIDDNGNRGPLDIAVGDKVIYSKYGGTEITIDGEDLLILTGRDVLCRARPRGGFAALVQRRRNAHPSLFALADQDGEFRRCLGCDLKQGFHFEHTDRADFLFCDLTLAADFRQQPFGIGIAFAPDIQAEPHPVGHVARCSTPFMGGSILAFAFFVRALALLARGIGARGIGA